MWKNKSKEIIFSLRRLRYLWTTKKLRFRARGEFIESNFCVTNFKAASNTIRFEFRLLKVTTASSIGLKADISSFKAASWLVVQSWPSLKRSKATLRCTNGWPRSCLKSRKILVFVWNYSDLFNNKPQFYKPFSAALRFKGCFDLFKYLVVQVDVLSIVFNLKSKNIFKKTSKMQYPKLADIRHEKCRISDARFLAKNPRISDIRIRG